jgi:hypothetical protein
MSEKSKKGRTKKKERKKERKKEGDQEGKTSSFEERNM